MPILSLYLSCTLEIGKQVVLLLNGTSVNYAICMRAKRKLRPLFIY